MEIGEAYARFVAKNPRFVQMSIGSQTSQSNHAETWVMLCLAIHGQRRMSDLIEFLGIPASTASFTVDKLIKRNLVTRTRPEDDRRVVVVSLTPEGSAMVQTIHDQTSGLMKYLLLMLQMELEPMLSDEEKRVVEKLLTRFGLVENREP